MKRGGATPKTSPVGWVFVGRHRKDGYTVRWKRGDSTAYVLRGNKVGKWTSDDDVLGKIPVSPSGWADVAEIRLAAETWVRSRACPTCGHPQ